MNKSAIRVGLDIGTTKIAAVVARIEDKGPPSIIGVGVSPCEGLRRGVVVNLEQTVDAINSAVSKAEQMADVEIRDAFIGVAGDHIKSLNSRGVIAVSRADHTITEKDIVRVKEAARAIRLPDEREILHVIPQEYIVDNQGGIKNPVDISGVRLEAEVHIVTGAVTSIQNIAKCVNRAGIEVRDVVLQPLASSLSVLAPDERELGCVLVDIGGGTTDLAVFNDDAIRYTSVIGLGGKAVTSDIAIGLRTPVEYAEEIKVKYGCALRSMINLDEKIEVPSPGDREKRIMSPEMLGTIIEPRMEELFTMVKHELDKNNLSGLLGAGVVLTGGASLLKGSAEMAEQILDMPVKVGYPRGFAGLNDIIENPAFATVLGLLVYGGQAEGGSFQTGSEGSLNSVMGKLKDWFKDFI